MGHDVAAYTRSGEHFYGPHFGRHQSLLYEYLEASHRNAGVSGDGEYEEMTPERLRVALLHVEQDIAKLSEGWLKEQLLETRDFLVRCIDGEVVRMRFC